MIGLNATISRSDMIRCALCGDAPCDAACEKVKPAALLRSIWFGNEQAAAQRLPVILHEYGSGCPPAERLDPDPAGSGKQVQESGSGNLVRDHVKQCLFDPVCRRSGVQAGHGTKRKASRLPCYHSHSIRKFLSVIRAGTGSLSRCLTRCCPSGRQAQPQASVDLTHSGRTLFLQSRSPWSRPRTMDSAVAIFVAIGIL